LAEPQYKSAKHLCIILRTVRLQTDLERKKRKKQIKYNKQKHFNKKRKRVRNDKKKKKMGKINEREGHLHALIFKSVLINVAA